MSTRGTYLIVTGQFIDHSICFYVHHDNYPEGAAHYFRRMHYYKNSRGHYAGRFFRANSNAEFTVSHDSHWDTEYRYTLGAQGQLTVLYREVINMNSDNWVNIYEGPWYEFVNQQLPDEEKLYLFKTLLDTEVMTLKEAKRYICNQRALAKKASDRGHIGNASSYEDEAERFQIQIDAILQGTQLDEV